VLSARGVSRSFCTGRGEVAAVREVSLDVHAGELVVLTGPSGSGKTTLLHMLSAIATPDAGAVMIEGQPVAALDRGARADLRLARLGLVFAQHNLSPALTAAENVDLPLALRGLPRSERAARVTDALGRLGVGALAERFPDALSSGEQQRVATARAIAGAPAALVADEPTAHLDSDSARAMLVLLAQLVRERGMAALVATHDPQVLELASRVVRMRDGRVLREEQES